MIGPTIVVAAALRISPASSRWSGGGLGGSVPPNNPGRFPGIDSCLPVSSGDSTVTLNNPDF